MKKLVKNRNSGKQLENKWKNYKMGIGSVQKSLSLGSKNISEAELLW